MNGFGWGLLGVAVVAFACLCVVLVLDVDA
jgi:hypothetical protein